MVQSILHPKEKKVEYIELIFDLIFVYIVRRNIPLLHTFENGFVTLPAFLTYIITTMAVIRIWFLSTYYINAFGRRGVRDHVFLFTNMFLLYFMGEGTRSDWLSYHTQYHAAWALILVNIGVHHLIELRNHKGDTETRSYLMRMAAIMFAEAAMVASDIFVYQTFGNTWMSATAILFGLVAVRTFGRRKSADAIDFPHMSERIMLYVVFTFGEMIICVSSYFDEEFSISMVYFALMAFLVVVGLLLSYGVYYDRVVDREKRTNGLGYMLVHIFIIFALNNITNGLEFMREEEVSLVPKMLFLIGSIIIFFGCLLALGSRHAKPGVVNRGSLYLRTGFSTAVFAALMLLLRENMTLNIFVTVAYIFSVFITNYRYGKQFDKTD